jgi:hypothetical protein
MEWCRLSPLPGPLPKGEEVVKFVLSFTERELLNYPLANDESIVFKTMCVVG